MPHPLPHSKWLQLQQARAAADQLQASASDAHAHSVFLFELMLAMDWRNLLPRSSMALAAVGKAVLSMPESFEHLRPLLEVHAVDLESAVAAAMQ